MALTFWSFKNLHLYQESFRRPPCETEFVLGWESLVFWGYHPCRMTGVTLHSHVRYKETQARICCVPLFSVKRGVGGQAKARTGKPQGGVATWTRGAHNRTRGS